MGRAIAGVIVGYIAMAAMVFATFTGMWAVLKSDGSFQEGTYEISDAWFAGSLALGFLAAIIGGFVCVLIATCKSKAPMVLAGIILVLGLAMGIVFNMDTGEDTGPAARAGDVTMREAMENAEQPPSFALMNPIIGAVGVLIGARLRGGGT